MSLSQPRTLFGIHEFVPYERATGLPYGVLRVLGGSTLTLTGELIQLSGGSSPYAWDAQDGAITSELSIKPKEIPNFLVQLFLGKSPTEVLADPGNVTTLTNVNGDSCVDATTGIATVSVKSGSETDLKFGKFIVKVVSATTVDVYALTSVDFKRGTDLTFQNDDLKITASALTITASTAVTIPSLGVELTGGSGTVAMDIGDTAEFEINPPSLIETYANIGELGASIPEFGALVTAQKKSDGTMWIFDIYRVKALGFPFGMEAKAFNEAEITAVALYDSAKDGLFKMRYLVPSSGVD